MTVNTTGSPTRGVALSTDISMERSTNRLPPQLGEMQMSSTSSPKGGAVLALGSKYCQLYCTTFSVEGLESKLGSGSTSVITTPSSPAGKPPLPGLNSRSQTRLGQKLLRAAGLSTLKQAWKSFVQPVVDTGMGVAPLFVFETAPFTKVASPLKLNSAGPAPEASWTEGGK